MQTTSFLKAAILATTLVCGNALAVPQGVSSLAFDISWDSGSLGAGWIATLSGEPVPHSSGGARDYTSTLTFSNPGAASSATWAGEFSVSIRPRTRLVTSTEIYTSYFGGEYVDEDNQLVVFPEARTYRRTSEVAVTGGVIRTVTSTGLNTLPAVVQLPSAYGYNQLSVTATAAAQTFGDSRATRYLDAAAGNDNRVVINPPEPKRLFSDLETINVGETVQFNGRLYIARQTIFTPGYDLAGTFRGLIDSGPYVPPIPFGGELDLPVELTIKSEVWTPTFMQPSRTVRHCAVIDCMVATDGQYLPQSFNIALTGTLGPTTVTVEDITTPVPEPGAGLMLLAGLGLLGAVARRRAMATGPI